MKEKDINIRHIQRTYPGKVLVNGDLCLYLENKTSVSTQPYRMKNLLCYFCLSGEVTLLLNGERLHIQAPAFVTWFPESVIEEEQISGDFLCAIIAIDKPLLLALPVPELPDVLLYMATHPVIPLPDVKVEQILQAWQTLCSVASVDSPYRHRCLAHLLATAVYHPQSLLPKMLAHTSVAEEVPYTEHDGQLVNRCLDLINRHCAEERFVGYYAEQLRVTPAALNAAFRRRLGCSVTDAIHRALMRRAEILLIATRDSVADIASELCFKAPGHFVTFFRKNRGVTPDRFRHERDHWIAGEE